MSAVQYDENFDRKVEAGALTLLRDMADRGLLAQPYGNLDQARQEARLVLLAAMAVDAGVVIPRDTRDPFDTTNPFDTSDPFA